MGRIQCKGKGKGISSTITPFRRKIAKWVSHTPKTITELIVAMAKKGSSPSQIGVAIRDKEGVPSTKLLTGQKIVRILKKNGKSGSYSRLRPADPRRHLLPDPQGHQHSQASVEEQEGQGCQVPPHSDRVTYPPTRQVLQASSEAPRQVEIVTL